MGSRSHTAAAVSLLRPRWIGLASQSNSLFRVGNYVCTVSLKKTLPRIETIEAAIIQLVNCDSKIDVPAQVDDLETLCESVDSVTSLVISCSCDHATS